MTPSSSPDSLETMAGGLAHEIRNPLNAMGFQLHLLRTKILRGAASSEVVPLLDGVRDEVNRLEDLVGQFLRLVRAPRPNPRPVDINILVRSLADFLGPEMEAHGKRLELDLKPRPLTAMADEAQLKQALLNLIVNARDMSPAGTAVLVSARGEKDQVVVEVLDRGPGVAPAMAQKIFQPFFTTREGGTGLGLAIVKRVVEAVGGSVEHVPRDGGGAIFRMALPGSSGEGAHA